MKENQHIDLNNYESWFLLFADNELSEIQKQMVFSFVAQNPFLQQELNALLNTINIPESKISFSKKSSLLKEETHDVITDEELILFLDNEASAATIKRINSNKSVQLLKRIENLKKTYSVPDTTRFFENKSKLYKRKPFVKMYYWLPKVAAIVAFLIISVWMFDNYFSKPITNGSMDEASTIMPGTKSLQENNVDTSLLPKANDSRPINLHTTFTNKTDNEARIQNIQTSTANNNKTNNIKSEYKSVTVASPDAIDNSNVLTHQQNDLLPKDVVIDNKENAIVVPQHQVEKVIQYPATEIAKEAPIAENKTKRFFKSLSQKVKQQAINILTDDNENVNVAGFAINIRK